MLPTVASVRRITCDRSGKTNTIGWELIPDPVETPCQKAVTSATKMDEIYERAHVSAGITQIANLNQNDIEHGFPVFAKYSVSSTNPSDFTVTDYYSSSTIYHGDATHINYNYTVPYLQYLAAVLHSHPVGTYNGPSAKDVYLLIESLNDDSHITGNFMVGSNGDQFALTVTDKTQAANFFATQGQNLDGTTWKDDTEVGKAFLTAKDYYRKKHADDANYTLDLEYEFGMAVVLSNFNTGITLNKRDLSGHFIPMIIKSAPTPGHPRKITYTQECL